MDWETILGALNPMGTANAMVPNDRTPLWPLTPNPNPLPPPFVPQGPELGTMPDQGPELGQWATDQGPELGVPHPVPPPAAAPGMPVSLAPPNPGAAPAVAPPAASRFGDLAKMLQGVQAPKPPEVQKVSTPHIYPSRGPGAPKLLDVLTAMGLGRPAAQAPRPGLTLGQALRG